MKKMNDNEQSFLDDNVFMNFLQFCMQLMNKCD